MSAKTQITGNKFGAFKGVFIPSILTILGVILFLRLGWVVGQAGVFATIVIILLSSAITLITGLSISSTATNMKVGPGGSYFLISRCFGVEPGAAVGIPLYLAQALGISFYSVGFAESLQLFFPELSITLVAFSTLVLLTIITFISSDLALRMQVIIFVLIITSILTFWFGNPVGAEAAADIADTSKASFWMVFAVFFPAVTGIEAGISLSGDLKNPKKSLPIGTIGAVIVGCIVYIISAIVLNRLAPKPVLISNSLVLTEVATYSILIYLGLWGATLSSTMGALLGAPRTLQALANDRILPKILGRGDKKTNEPKIAIAFSFIIAAIGILAGDLNSIAAVLSMFFLTSYGALNLVAGLEGVIDNPSWRPTFRVSWLVSLLGAGMCFGAMFMINSGYSFIAFAAVAGVYLIMKRQKLKPNYSDIRSGLVSFFAREFVYKTTKIMTDARNWRPHFLVLSGSPQKRIHLIQLADTISHKRGFLTVASVLSSEEVDTEKTTSFERSTKSFLEKNEIEALVRVTTNKSFEAGAIGLIRNYGFGNLSPNTIVVGDATADEQIQIHANMIKEAYDLSKNVLIIKDSEETAKLSEKGGVSINVWWKDDSEHSGLRLAMAYMLKSSTQWMDADFVVKALYEDEEEKAGLKKNLNHFIKGSRIPARIQLIKRKGRDRNEVYMEECSDADVTFIGLKPPEGNFNYTEYYKEKILKTQSARTVIFVLESEDISFEDIFI